MLKQKGYTGDGKPVKKNAGEVAVAEDGATATFVLSNAQVDRYGDTIDCKGWELDNYKANPVVLFGHDATDVKNVVGRMVDIQNDGSNLVGTVEFVPEGDNPNADIVKKLVLKGFLKTVSVGFRPLEAKASSDPKRKGGWDFKKQELLEVSIVPVPALPSALAKAAELGFERKALEEVGAVTDVPELPKFGMKSFWAISWLASLMGDGQWILDCMDSEDAGKDQILAGLQAMGQALMDMTEETVAQLLAEHSAAAEDGEVKMAPTAEEMAFKFFELAQKDVGAAVALDMARSLHEKGVKVTFHSTKADAVPLTRAGRVLSKDNEAALVSVKTALTDAAGLVDKVLSQVAGEEEAKGLAAPPPENDEEAVRTRLAKAAEIRNKFRSVN